MPPSTAWRFLSLTAKRDGGWFFPAALATSLGGLMVVDGAQVRGLVRLGARMIFSQLLLELARSPDNLSVFTRETGVSSCYVLHCLLFDLV